MADVWASGDEYEPYVGRWSRLVAADFLDSLDLPAGRRWVDVGCGTGALTSAILSRCAPAEVLGVDPSDGFVAWARSHVDDPRASFRVGVVDDVADHRADVVVSGLALNFMPDPLAAATVMRGMVPGGVAAVYVWDYADRMELMRYFWDAVVAVDPATAGLDEAARFPVCRPDALEAVWRDAGLVDVISWAIDVPTVFGDFDDYWRPFLGGQGAAPAYVMSLDEDHRSTLREHLRGLLPVADNGSISLIARAWAVRGRSV
jgi:trans-aconitate methyltransferase